MQGVTAGRADADSIPLKAISTGAIPLEDAHIDSGTLQPVGQAKTPCPRANNENLQWCSHILGPLLTVGGGQLLGYFLEPCFIPGEPARAKIVRDGHYPAQLATRLCMEKFNLEEKEPRNE